jgi:hypothetical protein
MKFGIVLFGILSATVAPSMAQAANTNFSLYCPGESKLFIGADGSFIRPDKDTYLSWSREKQESYQSALSLQILRTDASTRAYESVTNYFRANPLEIHRKVEDALNKDENCRLTLPFWKTFKTTSPTALLRKISITTFVPSDSTILWAVVNYHSGLGNIPLPQFIDWSTFQNPVQI